MDSEAISDRWWNQGLVGHRGTMTVAEAPDCRSLATRSSMRSQGGLHHVFSAVQEESGRLKQSTASAVPSRQRAL